MLLNDSPVEQLRRRRDALLEHLPTIDTSVTPAAATTTMPVTSVTPAASTTTMPVPLITPAAAAATTTTTQNHSCQTSAHQSDGV